MKIPRFVYLLVLILLAASFNSFTQNGGTTWRASELSFRPLNITSNGSSLWVCGTDETIAVSTDSGSHWQIKHQTSNGNLLLNIAFATDTFGYAAGTGGLLLTTEDGGLTWTPHSTGSDVVLQISLADSQHGIIRTPGSLLFTADGGTNWLPVHSAANPDTLKDFPYPFSLVALDTKHMAVMLKQGTAQYEPQTLLTTEDSGKSWQISRIPNVTLYSFFRAEGKYWLVGTEVIHKDQPGGGYAVPVALYSTDGNKWDHATNDLSSCKLEMCVACNPAGCLSANGRITNFLLDKTTVEEFLPNERLTSKWASDKSAMCFVANQLQCTDIRPTSQAAREGGPVPVAVSPGPLRNSESQGPHCISCPLNQILTDKKVQGTFTIKLVIMIARNGTVTGVESDGAPSPGIKSQVEQQVQQWLFEPYIKDGTKVALKLNTAVRVNVLKTG